jgi:surface carbohydrate biosynthesis protein
MKSEKPTLLIPVELQVRELEPKVLLACVAAARGYPCIIGPRREMHFRVPSYPRSIYLSKSTTGASNNVFRHMQALGYKIVVWDEEALVALPPKFYFRHRLSSEALVYVSHLFAWGEENAQLWRNYPQMPADIPIHVTGNPRGDLLRPELSGYYQKEVEGLHREHGNFILINTNFNLVNAYYPEMNMIMPNPEPGEPPLLTRRSISLALSREYAEGFTDYKLALLGDFEKLVPELEKTFSDYTIVIRPHPAENQEVYKRLAAMCQRVRVVHKGNVVPWLLAAKVLVHNGCTTGIEAYATGTPAVAYRPRVHEQYDRDFHDLPNQLSHQCCTIDEMQTTLEKILAGELGVYNGDGCKALMQHHLASQEGPLACERIVDVLEKANAGWAQTSGPDLADLLRARIWSTRRRVKKRLRGMRPNMRHNRPEFLHHRYPGVSLDEMRDCVVRFQELLGYEDPLSVKRIAGQFFKISG